MKDSSELWRLPPVAFAQRLWDDRKLRLCALQKYFAKRYALAIDLRNEGQ